MDEEIGSPEFMINDVGSIEEEKKIEPISMPELFENQLILSGHANETIKVNNIPPKKVLIVDDNNYSSLALKSIF